MRNLCVWLHQRVALQSQNQSKLPKTARILQKKGASSESLVQASGTKAQVLALLSHTELQRYKPRLKERRFWLFVPYMYIAPP